MAPGAAGPGSSFWSSHEAGHNLTREYLKIPSSAPRGLGLHEHQAHPLSPSPFCLGDHLHHSHKVQDPRPSPCKVTPYKLYDPLPSGPFLFILKSPLLAIPLLDISLKELEAGTQADNYTPMVKAVLLTQPEGRSNPTVHQQMKGKAKCDIYI